MGQSYADQLQYGAGIPAQGCMILGNLSPKSAPVRSVAVGLTAAGTDLATAFQMTAFTNVFATVGASSGAKLPPDTPIGETILYQNNGSSIMNLFPPSSTGTINGGTGGAAVTVAVGAGGSATRLSATDWLVTVTAKES